MPTTNELATLYQRGVGWNMPPFFQTSSAWVWGEPKDASSAWGFLFNFGKRDSDRRDSPGRVFGVRARPPVKMMWIL